jgi:hypothetical protein
MTPWTLKDKDNRGGEMQRRLNIRARRKTAEEGNRLFFIIRKTYSTRV